MEGVLAQLVERLNGIQKVRSSSLLGSTIANVGTNLVLLLRKGVLIFT